MASGMAWTDPIDAYCERLGADFWAEPLNAWTNLAFLLAALLALRLWIRLDRRALANCRRRDLSSLVLVALVGVIGVGSFLFHTFADHWSVLADVVPIGVFIYAYLALALRRFVGLPRWKAVLGTVLFAGASVVVERLLQPVLGGSAAYAPALLALFGLGGWLTATGRRPGRLVLGAGLVFAVSLTLRTLDGPLCESFPIGTHLFWHLLNAATLGLLLLAAVRQGPRPAKRRITP